MSDRLPPLTALRAFEAAARHMSFAKAAEELHVTPAALSFQIKSLETHLGAPVFRRLNRAVELTAEGRALRGGVAEGFDLITTAWQSARRQSQPNVLTVTAGPAFTAKWLAPRLYGFAQKHPGIDLRFSATLRLVDFDRDEIDVAVRFGYPKDDGLFSKRLMSDWVTPVMTPELLERFSTPQSLVTAPLIFDDSVAFLDPPVDWTAWFALHGIAAPDIAGARFSQADHAIDAALSGAGVLLTRGTLAAQEIIDGRLVAPFEEALTTDAHFRFVCRAGDETKPHVATFLSWLEDEIACVVEKLPPKTLVPAPPRK